MIEDETLMVLCACSARCFGLIISLPLGEMIQSLPRLLLAVGLGWIVMPEMTTQHLQLSPIVCLWEFGVGVVLGAPLRFVVDIGEMFGELVDTARGQTISSLMDPLNSQASSDLAVVCRTAVAAIALHVGALDALVRAVADSFRVLPVGAPFEGVTGAEGLLRWGVSVLSISLRVTVLWFAAFLLTDITTGLASRLMKGVQFSLVGGMVKTLLTGILLTALVTGAQHISPDQLRSWMIGPAGVKLHVGSHQS